MGGAELEAVWERGYARDKKRNGVYTNLCAAGVLAGSKEIRECIYSGISNTSRPRDTSFKSLTEGDGRVCKWII